MTTELSIEYWVIKSAPRINPKEWTEVIKVRQVVQSVGKMQEWMEEFRQEFPALAFRLYDSKTTIQETRVE